MANSQVVEIGDRLELFVDRSMVSLANRVDFRVHQPTNHQLVFKFDQPWEGNVCAYYTLITEAPGSDTAINWKGELVEEGLIRLYYRGGDYDLEKKEMRIDYRTCYAESSDGGETWIRPNLGLFEFEGSLDNNIIWESDKGSENFTPFRDDKPGVDPSERYKAIGYRPGYYKLYAMTSPDGVRWKWFYQGKPLLTYYHGKFDTQNIALWDRESNKYIMFYRDYIDKEKNIGRGTKICYSDDFIHWSGFKWLKYNDNLNQSLVQLYTNCIQQYYRAPHQMIGFPNRFNERRIGAPGHPITGVFDVILMASRNGQRWDRTIEPIIKPGINPDRWVSRNSIVALGMIETGHDEDRRISILSSEGYYLANSGLRRHSFRLDGFVSAHADIYGGKLIIKPVIFSGDYLILNLSSSAMGCVYVEFGDPRNNNRAYPGFELKNALETFGDSLEKRVSWRAGDRVSSLAGQPVQITFIIKDCDLYSFRFIDGEDEGEEEDVEDAK